jgi:formylmethanofuran dehydrogenase subunit B
VDRCNVCAGAADDDLLRWAESMWWCIWVRQAAVNYMGMWRKRFEKEDSRRMREVESKKDVGLKEVSKGEAVEDRVEKVRGRLNRLNAGLMSLE